MADRPAMVLDTGLALLRLAGDRQLYGNLLAEFRSRHGGFADLMRAALASGDGEAARRLAHGLKSAAGSLGAIQLQQAAARLEDLFRDGHTDLLAEILAETELELSLVLNELAALGPGAGPPLGDEVTLSDEEAMAVLRRLVRQDDAEALGMAEVLARRWADGPYQGGMEHIRILLRRYDFAGALEVIDDMDFPAARPPG